MKVEELALALSEVPHVHNPLYLDTHSLEGFAVSNRRDNQFPRVFETNEASVKQAVNTRREQ